MEIDSYSRYGFVFLPQDHIQHPLENVSSHITSPEIKKAYFRAKVEQK
jgi:hypothetical protein